MPLRSPPRVLHGTDDAHREMWARAQRSLSPRSPHTKRRLASARKALAERLRRARDMAYWKTHKPLTIRLSPKRSRRSKKRKSR